MIKLINLLKEMKIVLAKRAWDFTKYNPNFKFENIKVGDKLIIKDSQNKKWTFDISRIGTDVIYIKTSNSEAELDITSQMLNKWNDKAKSNLDEMKIEHPPKIHNLDKPGVKATDIKIGDTIQFTLNQPKVETVRQKIIGFKSESNGVGLPVRVIISQDLDKDGNLRTGKDFWTSFSIENYHLGNK